MKKRKVKSKVIIIIMLLFLVTGCTTTLVDKNKEPVQNPETGQSLTENILCQPENEQTRKLYEENGVKLKDLPNVQNLLQVLQNMMDYGQVYLLSL